MRRIGNRFALLCAVGIGGAAFAGNLEFYQTVDRNEIGVEDPFRLTIVTSTTSSDANLQLPTSDDFEILSRQESREMSTRVINGKWDITQLRKFILLMRAKRVGVLTVPPSVLTAEGKTYKTEAIRMTVKKGRLAPPAQAHPPPMNPFQALRQQLGAPDDDDGVLPETDVPRSQSDLFLKSFVDRTDVYVGEQVTLSLYIYSRVDLSEVTQLNMPKLDGFWAEDIDSPTQLSGEEKILNGVRYRAYLVKRRALFPVKPGTLSISGAEVDVVTGFIFSGRPVHRVGNDVAIKVRPLPPGGKPANFSTNNVGSWRLSTDVSQTQVELGQPVTVKVIVEGRGNLKNVATPPLVGPPGVRVFDPTTTDKTNVARGALGGKRVQEYLVMPQQTGTFTLPPLTLSYFDPDTERYEVSKTDPIALNVTAGAGGASEVGGTKVLNPALAAKNVLTAGGLRPLRYQTEFSNRRDPLWRRPFFVPAALAPVGLWMALGFIGFVRGRLNREDQSTLKRKQTRAARRRLAAAEKIKASGTSAEFYGEVEKAVLGFLEAKLGSPVGGLTREGLADRLRSAGVPLERQKGVLTFLDQCDLGRFAPGEGGASREQILNQAEEVMEGWS